MTHGLSRICTPPGPISSTRPCSYLYLHFHPRSSGKRVLAETIAKTTDMRLDGSVSLVYAGGETWSGLGKVVAFLGRSHLSTKWDAMPKVAHCQDAFGVPWAERRTAKAGKESGPRRHKCQISWLGRPADWWWWVLAGNILRRRYGLSVASATPSR